jgi:hypothetical protein
MVISNNQKLVSCNLYEQIKAINLLMAKDVENVDGLKVRV